jgi:hypothetical protein
MVMTPLPPPNRTTLGLVSLVVPGPDRKRQPAPYSYRIAYRNPDAAVGECVMVWDVYGGRMPYQVAAERDRTGIRYHCTCADAVYRGDVDPRHVCKHVAALLDTFPPSLGEPVLEGGDGRIGMP